MTISVKDLHQDLSGPTNEPYREVIGNLIHIMNVSRPDIAFALSVFSRYNSAPRTKHWEELQRIIWYLNATKNYGLKFGGKTPNPTNLSNQSIQSICFNCFCDSDFATDPADRISQIGYAITLNNSAVIWKSQKLPMITQSTCESELMGINACANEIKWVSMLVSALDLAINRPIQIYCDNQSAITCAPNPQSKTRLKHVDTRQMKTSEYIASGLLQVHHISTHMQPADIFTKPLARILFERHRNALGVDVIPNVV